MRLRETSDQAILPCSVMDSREDEVLRGRSRILVVDDSSVMRHWIASFFGKQSDYEIELAASGDEALRLVELQRPSLVLTDLLMPDLNGFELVGALRESHPDLPVILLTAYGSEDIAVQALRVGATNYVPKKHLERDLLDTVRGVLSLCSSARKCDLRRQGDSSIRSKFVVGNDSELIAPLIAMLLAAIDVMGICDENGRTRVGVALHEALSNALYHGNLEVSSDLRQDDERLFYHLAKERRGLDPYKSRQLEVVAEIDPASAKYTIRYEGPGYEVNACAIPVEPEDLMRVGGRGLLLIRTFMDEVHHNERGNEITLVRRRMNNATT